MTRQPDAGLVIDPGGVLVKTGRSLFWTGLVMILLGVAALIVPFFTSLVVEVLVGWLLTVSGLVSVIGAMSLRATGLFFVQFVAGLIALGAGLLMLIFPLQGLIALTVLLAVVLMLTGAAQVAFALWARPALGWAWGVLSALISMGLGVYILAALPVASTMVLGLLVGIDFVSTGVALVLISRSVRANDDFSEAQA